MEKYIEYLNYLVGKTYKILVLKENDSDTLHKYLEDFQRELIGNKEFVQFITEEPKYYTIVSKVEFMINHDPDVNVYKKDVFKSIRILTDIRNKIESKTYE